MFNVLGEKEIFRLSPWHIVESDNKKKARINCINHILNTIDYRSIEHPEVILPRSKQTKTYKRPHKDNYKYVKEIL